MSDPRHTEQSLSHALIAAVGDGTDDYISLADLVAGIKTRALALLLVLFSLPNILPALPGTSAITGAPLVLLTLQMMLGQGVWLPRVVANRAVPRAGFLAILARAQPYFNRVEKMLRPRQLWLTSPFAQRVLGGLMLALSVIIMLPIPLANALPGLAILIIAMGIAERDGYFVLAGLMVAMGGVVALFTFYDTIFTLALAQITPWF